MSELTEQGIVLRPKSFWHSRNTRDTAENYHFTFEVEPDKPRPSNPTTREVLPPDVVEVPTVWFPETHMGGAGAIFPPTYFIRDCFSRQKDSDILVHSVFDLRQYVPWETFYRWYQKGRQALYDRDKLQDAAIEEMEMIGAD